MNTWLLFAAGCVAFCTAMAITPIVGRAARRIGLIDQPDAHRKIHARATPLGGGVAVLFAAGTAFILTLFIPSATSRILAGNPGELLGILIGLGIICIVGLWDDLRGLRARHKLVGQCIAAGAVVAAGLRIDEIGFAGKIWELGPLGVPLTICWLVLCMNALNLIDGADGLATTVGIVLFGSIAAISLSLDNELPAYTALALCGALLGFLWYNLPPARIFLGDAGSMSLGFLAGSLAVHTCIKGAAAFAITAPLAMWVLPILDVTMAIVRRRLTGRGLSSSDRLHLHHSLLNRGISDHGLLVCTGGLSILGGLGSWLTVRYHNEWFAILSFIAICGLLAGARLFGHVELRLASHHLAALGRSCFESCRTEKGHEQSWGDQVRLQGDRDWESLWKQLIVAGESFEFSRVKLDLNLPWMHEGFHASWVKTPRPESGDQIIRLEWPLVVEGRRVGSLSISGAARRDQALWLARLADFLIGFQEQTQKVYYESRSTDLSSTVSAPPSHSQPALSGAGVASALKNH